LDLLQVTARTVTGWMIYGLLEGAILALFVWLLLRFLPRQNAGTRFIFWFSALLAMFFLPLLGAPARPSPMSPISAPSSLIHLPLSWAIAIFATWALIATINLTRVLAALWQIKGLRSNSEKVDQQILNSDVVQLLRDFHRPVSLLLSDQVQVPTATGFLKPTIVLPRWFVEEISPEELKHVLVHELSHLRRGDDWTNLAQKLIRALLFFHPSAWWVEQQLSLEREMACDDEVLRRTGSPVDYAQCLKRIAEKSFLRRQLALAQAVVSRMRQVSMRVAQILDVNRPGTTRIWKPALPLMVLAVSLCGFSAWMAPSLVAFTDDFAQSPSPISVANDSRPDPALVKEVKASFTPSTSYSKDSAPQPITPRRLVRHSKPIQPRTQMAAIYSPELVLTRAQQAQLPEVDTYRSGDYVVQSAQYTVTMTGDQGTWQVQMWQVNVTLSPDPSKKVIPRKKI
jgi:beta-lactamase regulating signal transducer with metallopeptidase domain